MLKTWVLACAGIALLSTSALSQFKSTSVPIGNAVGIALAKGSLTGEGARPFHIRIAVSEPENPQSPYQGTIEEWWAAPDRWRLEATSKDGMHQTVVMGRRQKDRKGRG